MAGTLSSTDREMVAELARRVSEALTSQRLRLLDDSGEAIDEEDFARRIAGAEIMRMRSVADGRDRSFTNLDDTELTHSALEQVFGLGRLQPLLNDPSISDIHVRGSASVWVKRRDGSREILDPIVDTDQELVDLIRHIATRHTNYERRFDSANPELNIQLVDGSRVFATMEVSMRPSLIVRRHSFDIATLDELLDRGFMSTSVAAFLVGVVRARSNLVIAGGTGSGKTTLLRALINEVPANERIVTIEDAYELGIERFEDLHPDYDSLQARPANTEGLGEISLAQLTRMALRMDPDRVIVGEVRGGEAFPMLMAMSQGNNGSMCTLHADSARSVFPKLAAYVSMASTGLPVDTVNLLLASSIHFVIHIQTMDCARRITSIHEVIDADGITIASNEIFAINTAGVLAPAFPIRSDTMGRLMAVGFDPGHVRIGSVVR